MPLTINSYRPISLLNVDFKIVSKVLASRMEYIIPDIISQDQRGFIKGRHSFINIRTLLNVVHSPASESNPEVAQRRHLIESNGIIYLLY